MYFGECFQSIIFFFFPFHIYLVFDCLYNQAFRSVYSVYSDIIYYLLLYTVQITNLSTASQSDDGGVLNVLNFVPTVLPSYIYSFLFHFFLLVLFSLSFIIPSVPVGGYLEKHQCTSSWSLIAVPDDTIVFLTMQLGVVYFGACIQYKLFCLFIKIFGVCI